MMNHQEEQWFAVHVRSRHEKKVCTLLAEKGLEHFLPLQKEEHRWADRTKRLEVPLFPNYVFCRHSPALRVPVLNTPGVIGIAGTRQQPLPIDEEEIAALRAVVRSGLPCEPLPELIVGKRVRLIDGPLTGMDGLVTDIRKNLSLVVGITLLQRSVLVAVDPAWVRFIDPVGPSRHMSTAA